jgi:hypothetical protein
MVKNRSQVIKKVLARRCNAIRLPNTFCNFQKGLAAALESEHKQAKKKPQ